MADGTFLSSLADDSGGKMVMFSLSMMGEDGEMP